MPAIKFDTTLMRLIKEMQEVRAALRHVTTNLPLYDVANENTPASISTDQNDYVPGNYDILRMEATASVSITGIANGKKGRYLRIFNIGSSPITLIYQSSLSVAANRFKFSNGKNTTIPPSSNLVIYYDDAQSRWIGGDTLSSGAIYFEGKSSAAQSIPDSVSTKVNFGTIVSDQYGFWDSANTQINVLFDGAYHFWLYGTWDGDPNGQRRLTIAVDGTSISTSQIAPIAAEGAQINVNAIVSLTRGQVVAFFAYQNRGSASLLLNYRGAMVKVA